VFWGLKAENLCQAEYILRAQRRTVKRSFLVAVGTIIGLFFAALAVTGVSLLLTEPFLSKPYTVTIAILSMLLAYVGFRVAIDALHTKSDAH
jgi:uncharacterized protein YacL